MILCELFGVTTFIWTKYQLYAPQPHEKAVSWYIVTDTLHVTGVIAESLSCAQVYDVLVGLLTSLRVQYVNSTDHCVPCTAR